VDTWIRLLNGFYKDYNGLQTALNRTRNGLETALNRDKTEVQLNTIVPVPSTQGPPSDLKYAFEKWRYF